MLILTQLKIHVGFAGPTAVTWDDISGDHFTSLNGLEEVVWHDDSFHEQLGLLLGNLSGTCCSTPMTQFLRARWINLEVEGMGPYWSHLLLDHH